MKNHREVIELTLPSILGYERIVIDASASVARLMGFSDDRIDDLKFAVGEACINAIEHGNKQDANVNVVIELIVDETSLEVDIYDHGEGIVGEIKKPDIDAKIAGKQNPRGWGLFLIQSLMDEVEFKKIPEHGNVTRMIIHLKKNTEEDNAAGI